MPASDPPPVAPTVHGGPIDARPPRAKVILAGGSGFIGAALADALSESGREVVVLSRGGHAPRGARGVTWDARALGPWQRELEGAEAIVNLAGAPVACKWTAQARRAIVESRTASCSALAESIAMCADPPRTWINASAVGVYGNSSETNLDETADLRGARGFLAEACAAWERAVENADTPKTRKVRLRIGVVLGKEGGALPVLARLAAWFLGGRAGDGRQALSWIHIDDLAELTLWLLGNDVQGPVNACAPNPVSNAELMGAVRGTLGRPWSPPVPAPLLRLTGRLVGPDSEMTLGGQRVLPRVALDNGFEFAFPELAPALEDLLRRREPRSHGMPRA